ncbi:unnamed protein product, partial [Brassica oleracea var. botrytis]
CTNVSCLDPENRRCRDSHKTDRTNGRRGETHKSSPLLIRKKRDFHWKMKKRSETRLVKVSPSKIVWSLT